MKKTSKQYIDLVVIGILSSVLVAILQLIGDSTGRMIATVGLLFFIPGYVLLIALQSSSSPTSHLEVFLASPGVSVIIVGLLGLLLGTLFGLTRLGVVLLIYGWIAVVLIIATLRRVRRKSSDSPEPMFENIIQQRDRIGKAKRWLNVSLGISLLLMGVACWRLFAITSRSHPQYTEFFIFDDKGGIDDFPRSVRVGDDARLSMGLINHESERAQYYIMICVDNLECDSIRDILLEDNEQWQTDLEITALDKVGYSRIAFSLYKEDADIPYRELHIWMDVVE